MRRQALFPGSMDCLARNVRSLEAMAIRGFAWALSVVCGAAVGLALFDDATTHTHRLL